jgi:hypothetical protein
MDASTFLVPRKAYSNGLKMTASITSPFATMRYCKTLCIRVHTHNGIFDTGIMQELLNGKRRKLLTMTMIPNTARIACCASCQKWSPSTPSKPTTSTSITTSTRLLSPLNFLVPFLKFIFLSTKCTF